MALIENNRIAYEIHEHDSPEKIKNKIICFKKKKYIFIIYKAF